jgi:hypothetical protein
MVMELSANGFGSPQVLMRERVDLICDAYDYLTFKNTYENQSYLRAEKNAAR